MPITADPGTAWIDQKRATGAMVEYGRRYSAGEFLPFYVPRDHMPQVDEDDYTQLVVSASTITGTSIHGPGCEFDVVPVQSLRAHQRIDHFRAKVMKPNVALKPIVVSRDGFILDGNHRWWEHVHNKNPWIAVIRVDLDFEPALDWLLSQPFVHEVAPQTPATQETN